MSSVALPTLRKKKTNRGNLPRRESSHNNERPELLVSAKDKSKVQDKIKKRLSTKIGLPPMPNQSAVPLPSNAMRNINNANRLQIPREMQDGGSPRPRVARPAYDPAVFSEPDFDPDIYVKKMLATATPAELDDFFQALQDSKNSTKEIMQKNVFRNYREFIMISKEIGTLESDMTTIRGLLGDLRGITTTMRKHVEVDEPVRAAGRRGARNSIIDFHQLNRNHLKALWQQVEGAQKVLPAEDGRRIIRESGAWLELNAATWRAKNKVHIVLLNDHLLIAQQRPKPSGSGQRLIAEHCFSLGDLKVRDFDDPDMKTAISIGTISTREKFVYKAASQDEKRNMLIALDRELTELSANQRVMDDSSKRLTGSHDVSRDSQIKRLSRRLSKIPTMQRVSMSGLSGGGDEIIDLAVVQEKMDALDQRIAHRDFYEAVKAISRGRKLVRKAAINDLAAELTSLRLDERTETLSGLLCDELIDEASKQNKVQEITGYLTELDRTDLASSTFLAARTKLLQKRVRGVLFDGDLSLYLSDLSLVTFTLLKTTTTIYQASFPVTWMSGLISWSRDRVLEFSKMVRNQLYGVKDKERGEEIIRECLEGIARQVGVLRDVGLDMSGVVKQALVGI